MPSLKKVIQIKNELKSTKFSHVNIKVFDWKTLSIELTSEMTGLLLLDQVCLEIGGILEKDYYGLKVVIDEKETDWIKGHKLVSKQLKKKKTPDLSFKFKHYPPNPTNILQNLTKYLLYKQLRSDLYLEHVIIKPGMIGQLCALVVQAERGQYLTMEKDEMFRMLDELHIIQYISDNTVDETMAALDSVSDYDATEAENEFVKLVSQLESYGIEPYLCYDQTNDKLHLGISHNGICTFVGEKRTHVFYWENIMRMTIVAKNFMFDLNVEEKKRRLGFKFMSKEAVKRFWKLAVDRQNFMTLNHGSEAKKVKSNNVIFRRKARHQFSGRSQKELMSSCQSLEVVPQPPVVRTTNPVNISRSNSVKAIELNNGIKSAEYAATLPRRSNGNKSKSIMTIDFNSLPSEKNSEQLPSSQRPQSWVSSVGASETLDSIEEVCYNEEANVVSANPTSRSDQIPSTEDNSKTSKLEKLRSEIIQEINNQSFRSPNENENDEIILDDHPIIDQPADQPIIEQQITQRSHRFIQKPPMTIQANGIINRHYSQTTDTQPSLQHQFHDSDIIANGNYITPADLLTSANHVDPSCFQDNTTAQSNEGLFFLKFVVLTTLVLLFIMITSLVIYYYYRSATIADLNNQKFSAEANKNLDLDSIKRFILHNDDP